MKKKKGQIGQGLLEYALLLGLIGLVGVLALTPMA